jgi:hypothetical protein
MHNSGGIIILGTLVVEIGLTCLVCGSKEVCAGYMAV